MSSWKHHTGISQKQYIFYLALILKLNDRLVEISAVERALLHLSVRKRLRTIQSSNQVGEVTRNLVYHVACVESRVSASHALGDTDQHLAKAILSCNSFAGVSRFVDCRRRRRGVKIHASWGVRCTCVCYRTAIARARLHELSYHVIERDSKSALTSTSNNERASTFQSAVMCISHTRLCARHRVYADQIIAMEYGAKHESGGRCRSSRYAGGRMGRKSRMNSATCAHPLQKRSFEVLQQYILVKPYNK